jgi:RNA polymerase sigma factor (sigma-70 family)
VRIVAQNRVQQVERLVRHHEPSVRGFLRFMGCPADLIDDLVQDVFLSVLASNFEERNDPSTAAFLRRVARNLLLKALGRKRREPLLGDLSLSEEIWIEFEAEDGGNAYVDALRGCFGLLAPRATEVLKLRYTSMLGGVAIAEHLGLKEAGVKSILVRAKKRLRDCIERTVKA